MGKFLLVFEFDRVETEIDLGGDTVSATGYPRANMHIAQTLDSAKSFVSDRDHSIDFVAGFQTIFVPCAAFCSRRGNKWARQLVPARLAPAIPRDHQPQAAERLEQFVAA